MKEIEVKTNDKSKKLENNILPIDDKTKEKWEEKFKDVSIKSNVPEAENEGIAEATKLEDLLKPEAGNEGKIFLSGSGGILDKINPPMIKPVKPIKVENIKTNSKNSNKFPFLINNFRSNTAK